MRTLLATAARAKFLVPFRPYAYESGCASPLRPPHAFKIKEVAKPASDSLVRALTSARGLPTPRMRMVRVQARPAYLLTLKELSEQGQLRPCLAHPLPLKEIAQAHALPEGGGLVGKVAISIR